MRSSVVRIQQLVRHSIRPITDSRSLYGKPCFLLTYPYWQVHDRLRWGAIGRYIAGSRRIQGWMRGSEAVALAEVGQSLPANALIVEIGSFVGCSTVLLAGGRKLQGSGKVHCIDPFDASGDAFSAPIYHRIEQASRNSLRQRFARHVRRSGLQDWVVVHQGLAQQIAQTWNAPIDMLLLDGDQSYEGVQAAYNSWFPFLKSGGIIAVHNSRPGVYDIGHDGQMRLVMETLHAPQYDKIVCIGTTTFAYKISD